ncbi:Alpha/Beta hydrolase protein [Apiospora arundinis]|uniref:Carboxypeptidase n=1 Tax=Apiospora arundinis TaxID=335852 RepID=A0ABR2IAN6_9PEZI
MVFTTLIAAALTAASFCNATPVGRPGHLSVRSPSDPKITIDFKETHICETTPGVKSYSGYVNLPASAAEGRAYDIHTFFWFFESRKDPANAPLSVWLQGGPGAPSVVAAVGENGPCKIAPNSKDTVLNPWSWNNEVNMLYIDQPVQTGFSYDRLINGTIWEANNPFMVTPVKSLAEAKVNATNLAGVFSSQEELSTANTTATAAHAAWQFMQTWMTKFPHYKPKSNKFSIWSESYGGHYGPTFAGYFDEQNTRIAAKNISNAIPLNLDTVGIVNGCLDAEIQIPFYPEMAYKNTYGIKIYNETIYKNATGAWPKCQQMIQQCRALAAKKDPKNTGTVKEVNDVCAIGFKTCFDTVHKPYDPNVHNQFDLTSPAVGPFPPKYAAGYLNSKEVQEALGVPLNFTGLAEAANNVFSKTGDFLLGHNVANLGHLLNKGVKVAFMYGDSDYQCNWLGGEAISLNITSKYSADFRKAGYTDIKTNKNETGGMVRQFGKLSFSRVYNAGHEVPYYQPETAYQIFHRTMFNKDVATGSQSTKAGCKKPYGTTGPADISSVKNKLPKPHKPECYFWDILETCSMEEKIIIGSHKAIFKDFIMVGYVAANGTTVHYS